MPHYYERNRKQKNKKIVGINEVMHKCSPFPSLFWLKKFFFSSSHSFSVQVFSYTANKEIRTDDLCLDVSKLNGPVTMLKCHHLKGNQLWEYDPVVSLLMTFDSKMRQLWLLHKPAEQHIPVWDHYQTDRTRNKVRVVFPLLLIHYVDFITW